MKTALQLPVAWQRRLAPLKVFVCREADGGEWGYLLASGRSSWWAR